MYFWGDYACWRFFGSRDLSARFNVSAAFLWLAFCGFMAQTHSLSLRFSQIDFCPQHGFIFGGSHGFLSAGDLCFATPDARRRSTAPLPATFATPRLYTP